VYIEYLLQLFASIFCFGYRLLLLLPMQVLEREKMASTQASMLDMLDPLDNLLQCQGLMTDQLVTSCLCTCKFVNIHYIGLN
jgi:hypothetical protein